MPRRRRRAGPLSPKAKSPAGPRRPNCSWPGPRPNDWIKKWTTPSLSMLPCHDGCPSPVPNCKSFITPKPTPSGCNNNKPPDRPCCGKWNWPRDSCVWEKTRNSSSNSNSNNSNYYYNNKRATRRHPKWRRRDLAKRVVLISPCFSSIPSPCIWHLKYAKRRLVLGKRIPLPNLESVNPLGDRVKFWKTIMVSKRTIPILPTLFPEWIRPNSARRGVSEKMCCDAVLVMPAARATRIPPPLPRQRLGFRKTKVPMEKAETAMVRVTLMIKRWKRSTCPKARELFEDVMDVLQ
mmetsp:Transcript_9818/g.21310  ORF Transcript_9818/g.21310 Transcript_9818/m.21310 type:complete len:292 (-) Transcript_9818:860-1735(-)